MVILLSSIAIVFMLAPLSTICCISHKSDFSTLLSISQNMQFLVTQLNGSTPTMGHFL